jgi:hypothetical protein
MSTLTKISTHTVIAELSMAPIGVAASVSLTKLSPLTDSELDIVSGGTPKGPTVPTLSPYVGHTYIQMEPLVVNP